MEKFDVGIFGLWYGNNYGSIITYYALSKVMEELGLTYAMIRNPLGREIDIESLERSHPLRFAKEKYKVTKLRSLGNLHELNQFFNAFLIGSDQMWNYHLSRPYKQSYFLDFADESKIKIAYATSFGRDKYMGPDEEKLITKKNLQRFDAISVRDDFSKRICVEDFNVSAQIVLDPVFLCPVEKYNELIEEVNDFQIDEDYIFAYILDPNPKIGESICKISKEFQKKVIVVFNQHGDKQKLKDALQISSGNVGFILDPTVKEWLYLFKNARYVLTDSFHGSCFSIIFQKPFIVLKNNGRGGSRFPFLLGNFGLLDCMVESPEEMYNKFMISGMEREIDYNKVYNIILDERKKSFKWLENAFHKKREILLKTVSSTLDMKKCTGCGACENICPVGAITMKENDEGFLNPVVDVEKCVNCGLCSKKCIALNPEYGNVPVPKCYAMMADDDTRFISSSGGMFSVVAEYILEKGGYVCGAAYKSDFKVEHIIIHDRRDLPRLRGSKYMQSHTNQIYKQIKELLEDGQLVLFTGMPCQVAGLYTCLGKDYENLYTIDLLCHGITSSKVFEKYHKDVLGGKELKRLEFKAKEPWGWHAGVNAYFTDGSKYSKPLESDMYFIAYLKSIAKNTVCGVCRVNKLPRQGDLTIGDFWGIPQTDPEMYDKKGTSLVLVNNEKAQKLFDVLRPRMKSSKEESLQMAIKRNLIIKQPYKLHKNRDEFFRHFNELDFVSLTNGCFHNNLYQYQYMSMSASVPTELHELYLIAKTAVEKSKGRKIVTWIRSDKFEKVLRDYFSKTVAFYVKKSSPSINNNIFPLEKIKGKATSYYVVALDPDTSFINELISYGYKDVEDFIFRKHRPIVLENYDCSKGRYSDVYGNTIDGLDTVIGKIVFRGWNNHLIFGEAIRKAQNLDISVLSNTIIEIGDHVLFSDKVRIMSSFAYNGSSKIVIKNNVRLTDAVFRVANHPHESSILINDNCTFETNLHLHANSGKKIIIGRDCMFSHDINIMSGDGHTIFDVCTGRNINSDYANQPTYRNCIVIGEHTWIGWGAFLLSGTNIGNGSIVGAKSVVKGQYPNNCSIAGNPAKIVRENIAWSRQMVATDMKRQCGSEEYVRLTSHSKPPISGLKVLVIGGTKFMGLELVRELLELGNDVTIATRGIRTDPFGINVQRLKMDISDVDSTATALRDKYFDVVFDNLSYCSIYTQNILSNVKCRRYIQLSSVEAYRHLHIDLKESDFDPLNIPSQLLSMTDGYVRGKRSSEALVYHRYKNLSAVTVRIPYVAPTNERLQYYCNHIIQQKPMCIDDISRGFTFVRATEVGKFLPWIAAQSFEGPINLASTGFVTIEMILNHIEKATGKKSIIDIVNGDESPFHVFNEQLFSMNMDKAKQLGYHTSDLNEWFWDYLDGVIKKAMDSAK